MVVGATSEPGAGFAEGLTPAGQRQLEAGLADLLPEAAQWPPMERWWGFRPCTPDEGPLLGKGPLEGLWLCTGHHRNGVLLAAISAALVAADLDGATGGGGAEAERGDASEAAALLAAFAWTRFGSP